MSSSNKAKAQDLQETNQKIIETLSQKKGSLSEVYSTSFEETKIVFEHKDYALSSSQESRSFGIRSICDGRLGFTTTNSSVLETQLAIAKESQEIAKISPVSEFHNIAELSGATDTYDEQVDETIGQIDPKELLKWSDMIVNEATSNPKVSIDRIEVSLIQQSWAINNSKGVRRAASQNSLKWYAMGMGKTSGEVTSFDYDGASVSHYKDIGNEITRSMRMFTDSVLGSLGARSGTSYKGSILLHPYAVLDLISDIVLTNCNGVRHQDGMSLWKDSIGKSVAVKLLNVIEDPLNKNMCEGWTPFDREGVESKKHSIIKDGVLNFVAQSCFSAKRGGVAPTGNASGSSRGLPAIGFNNVSIVEEKNGLTDEKMLKEFGRGLCLKRFSGNTDATSGQFSGVAKNSWWVENGEKAYPVQEVMISGNMFEALKTIRVVGGVAHKVHGEGTAPYMIIDGLSVTAG